MQQRTVDNYTIEAELGHGGMAVVYRALDERLGRHVALKVLHEHIASRDENRERFEREARAVARLEHPNIIRVYGFSSPSAPIQYIATELIDGPTLRDQIEARPFQIPEVGAMACLSIARALGHAHRSGVIHRDIKPENIMFTSAGVPRLMDFGLARVLDAQKLTQTGSILGSPAHMSPEIIEGLPVDARADVFAFGTVLYYTICGRLPFDGRNPAVILNAILGGDYAEPERVNPRVSPALGRIVERCLQTDPEARYANGDEVADALAAALEEIGITDPEADFRVWFADPDAGDAAMSDRLVAAWLDRGRQARERGQVARTLMCVDRVLALDPHHDAALALLEQTRKARRRAHVAWAALTVVLVVGLMSTLVGPIRRMFDAGPSGEPTAAGVAAVQSEGSAFANDEGSGTLGPVLAELQRPSGDGLSDGVLALSRQQFDAFVARTALSAAVAVVAEGGESARAAAEAVRRQREQAAREARADAESDADADVGVVAVTPSDTGPDVVMVEVLPITSQVRFRINPRAAWVELDGELIGQAYELLDGRELAVGQHTIAAFHEGMPDTRVQETFDVVAGSPSTVLLDVPWPPAILEVESDVEADVLFGDTQMGVANEPIRVPITGPDRTVSVPLVVIRSGVGGDPFRTTIELTAGQTRTVQAQY